VITELLTVSVYHALSRNYSSLDLHATKFIVSFLPLALIGVMVWRVLRRHVLRRHVLRRHVLRRRARYPGPARREGGHPDQWSPASRSWRLEDC
jgi:hypothetical protein